MDIKKYNTHIVKKLIHSSESKNVIEYFNILTNFINKKYNLILITQNNFIHQFF